MTDHRTGQKTHQQRALKIGLVSGLTKTKVRANLRARIVTKLGVTADSRATVSWFIGGVQAHNYYM